MTSNNKLNILMAHTQGGGVGYYRFWLPAKALRDLGHDVTYFTGEFDFYHDIHNNTGLEPAQWIEQQYKSDQRYDIFHNGYSTVIGHVKFAATLRNYAQQAFDSDLHVLVDIDDDPYSVPSYNPSFNKYRRTSDEKKNLLIHLRTSDAVSVTMPPLVSIIKQDAPATYLLPNYCEPLDWDHFPRDPQRDDDKSIRIMYCGGVGHYGDLATIKEVIERVMAKYDGKERPMVRLFWLGCTPDWTLPYMLDKVNPLANRAFYIQPCHINTYWRAIRWISPDILIAPVECNEFNKSKSDIKAYDAVIGNSAFLCTDWDTYDQLPQGTCFKARGDVQWQCTLEALIEDKSLRQQSASKLREFVFDTRQIKHHIYKWVDVYRDLISRPPKSTLDDMVRPVIYRP